MPTWSLVELIHAPELVAVSVLSTALGAARHALQTVHPSIQVGPPMDARTPGTLRESSAQRLLHTLFALEDCIATYRGVVHVEIERLYDDALAIDDDAIPF
jgi:hypothetical protein